MNATTSKRFPLKFVNAAEDIPRLIRVYAKCCGGECALVLRPPQQSGVLVHVEKTGTAHAWTAVDGNDFPVRPSTPMSVKEAVALVKDAQKGLGRPEPITLRGQWTGYLHCDGLAPRLELLRKVASYGTLRITSDPATGWSWEVERSQKWFSRVGQNRGTAQTLVEAIQKGLAGAMGLLGEACSLRDSRRRAAFDDDYAEKHPIRPAKEAQDPLERFKPKEPKAPKEAKPPKEPKAKRTRNPKTAAAPEIERPPGAAHPGPVGAPVWPHGNEPTNGKTSRPGTKKPAPPPEPPVADAGDADLEPDPEKDKLLMDAFSKAIAQALGQGG